MFARVAGGPSDADRLREIDVANESVHDHSAFISRFVATHAYASITSFLHQLNAASTSLSLSQAASFPHPPSITAVLSLLDLVDGLVDAHPPLQTANTRFGNPAFRDVIRELTVQSRGWIKERLREGVDVKSLPVLRMGKQRLMVEETADADGAHSQHLHLQHLPQKVLDSMRARGELPTDGEDSAHTHPHPHPSHESKEETPTSDPTPDSSTLSDDERLDRVTDVLCLYFHSSFGDGRRIDYGTGHELNFLCFLYALTALHFIQTPSPPPSLPTNPPTPSIYSSLSLVIFPRYLSLMRRLQSRYLLEPAGSRGVWGLDDFSFLPFLFGSSQLIHHPHLRPRSVRYPEVIDGVSGEWIYLEAVRWVWAMKRVSFAEHSPMLNDITGVRSWEAVNDGLMKMYEVEVLPVVVREPELCCSDSIHFPSALAGQQ